MKKETRIYLHTYCEFSLDDNPEKLEEIVSKDIHNLNIPDGTYCFIIYKQNSFIENKEKFLGEMVELDRYYLAKKIYGKNEINGLDICLKNEIIHDMKENNIELVAETKYGTFYEIREDFKVLDYQLNIISP